MAKTRRKTGERPAEPRRVRIWRGIKNQAGKIRQVKASDWAKAGIFVAAIIWGLWTKSIDYKSNQNQKQIAELQAANAERDKEINSLKWTAAAKEAEYNFKFVAVSSRVDACEKSMKETQERLRRIRNAARTLPPSPAKQQILDLTKPDTDKSGAMLKPMRADESIPRLYSNTEIPSIKDSRYFEWRQTN